MNSSPENTPHDSTTEHAEPDTDTDGAASVHYLHPDTARTPADIPAPRESSEGEHPVIEGELVDEDTDTDTDESDEEGPSRAVPVDPPEGQEPPPAAGSGAWQPVLPAWVRSRAEIGSRATWAVRYAGHTCAYHTVRSPLYAARLAAHSPRGAARATVACCRWIWDAENKTARSDALGAHDTQQYLKLSELRDEHVRKRLTVAMLALLALTAGVVLLILADSRVLHLAAGAAVVALLGVAGRVPDKPVASRAVVSTTVAKLTSDTVIGALGSLGIAGINQALSKGSGIYFPKPITREGPGWRADVDLPLGVTVGDILERRKALASGLRRPLGCVWPEADPAEHEGRLVLWVGDEDLAKATPKAWPLAKSGTVSLFEPAPFGTDPRGRVVTVLLMYANVLIGAMPGAGKTFALRVLMLAAALDATAQLRVFELKGSGDLSALEPVAHHYASGPDEGTIEACVASMREVYRELERRAKTLAELPRELCPENKVTPELARRRSLGLYPLVLAIDECQELFAHDRYGKEAAELATAIIKRGRALGVILILATQRPDRDSLPTGISANVGIRFCLRVMGQTENDMILGTSSYKNGIRATTFTARDKGIGWLVGAAEEPQIARGAYLDNPAAERVIARARAAREKAGTITGHAAGETTSSQNATHSVVLDIAAVLTSNDTKVWSETIVERLAELRPEVYGDWAAQDTRAKANALAAALKPFGIDTHQVHGYTSDGKPANRRGITADDIRQAAHHLRRKHNRE